MSSKKHKKRSNNVNSTGVPKQSSLGLPMNKVVGKQSAGAGDPSPAGRRFLAYLIDWYLGALLTVLPISLAASQILGDMTNLYLTEFPAPYGILAGAAALLFACVYYILIPWKLWPGQTPGKRICGVQIRMANGQPVDLVHLVLRQVVGIIVISGVLATASGIWHQMLSIVTGINFVHPLMYAGFAVTVVSCGMILFRRDHRCIHDFIGGTQVCLAPKKSQAQE